MKSVDLLVRAERRRRRSFATALIVYGGVGLVLVVLLAFSLAPALGTLDALERSSGDVRDTLTTTRDAFERFGTSLGDARASAQRAAVTARSSASTARQLASGMDITVFGLQPLAQLATSFESEAGDLDALGVELDGLAASLAGDETNVAVLRARVATLADRASLIAAGGEAISFVPVFYALLAWLGAQAVAAMAVGVALWRRPVLAGASGRAQHAA